MPALQCRIEDKSKKSYHGTNFDEVVLLIVSGMPQNGAITSTIVFEPFLQVDKMT
jgi:hypothetical protein